jgi:hypothetical protein
MPSQIVNDRDCRQDQENRCKQDRELKAYMSEAKSSDHASSQKEADQRGEEPKLFISTRSSAGRLPSVAYNTRLSLIPTSVTIPVRSVVRITAPESLVTIAFCKPIAKVRKLMVPSTVRPPNTRPVNPKMTRSEASTTVVGHIRFPANAAAPKVPLRLYTWPQAGKKTRPPSQ